MYEVTMPKLSDSMETGKIIEWVVKEGDEVHEGDVLAEVESDKAVMELECFRDGVVAQILHGDGDEVRVGEVIARIRLEGEEAGGAPGQAEAGAKPAPPAKAAGKRTQKAPPAGKQGPRPEPDAEATDRRAKPAPAAAEGAARLRISPYARKLAEERGVDYTRVRGTGPEGRIVARDIEEAAAARAPERQAAPAPRAVAEARAAKEERSAERPPRAVEAPSVAAEEELPALELSEGEAEVEEASFRLKTQARRVVASQRAIPHFYVTRGVDVTALFARKDEVKARHGATFTHLIAYACLKALKEHPEINRSYDRGRVVKWKGVNLGLAVATDEGLTVAVLRGAESLPLRELAERSSELVERARGGKLTAEERRHATFTITNLGMFDVEHFEPIINPPSSVTLAVSSVLPAALVKDDAIHIGRLMKLTAACDHRIVDGVAAARFLSDLRALLEDPDKLLGEAKAESGG